MSKLIIHANIHTGTQNIKNGFLRFNQQIINLGKMCDLKVKDTDEIIDAEDAIVVPGFIDVHTHGGYNFDVWNATSNEISKLANLMAANEGITSFFATTVTQTPENISKAILNIKKAAKENKIIQGIHLEGPFVSQKFKGAQPANYIQKPDVSKLEYWNKISNGLLKMITFAPELENSAEIEDYCLKHGIIPAGGHSNATRMQMKHSKVSHITHLYNAQRELKHREPGVSGHALLEDNIYVEIIADGYHVCPDMINLAYKLKHADRIELVTDAMRAKGMSEGVYDLGGQKVTVKDNQARIAAGNLAGSVLNYSLAFKNIIKFTGCSLDEAILMSSVNQAREFGLSLKGILDVGKDADINILDSKFNVQKTFSYGHLM